MFFFFWTSSAGYKCPFHRNAQNAWVSETNKSMWQLIKGLNCAGLSFLRLVKVWRKEKGDILFIPVSTHCWPNFFVLFSFLSALLLSLLSTIVSFFLGDAIYLLILLICTFPYLIIYIFPCTHKASFLLVSKTQKTSRCSNFKSDVAGFDCWNSLLSAIPSTCLWEPQSQS